MACSASLASSWQRGRIAGHLRSAQHVSAHYHPSGWSAQTVSLGRHSSCMGFEGPAALTEADVRGRMMTGRVSRPHTEAHP